MVHMELYEIYFNITYSFIRLVMIISLLVSNSVLRGRMGSPVIAAWVPRLCHSTDLMARSISFPVSVIIIPPGDKQCGQSQWLDQSSIATRSGTSSPNWSMSTDMEEGGLDSKQLMVLMAIPSRHHFRRCPLMADKPSNVSFQTGSDISIFSSYYLSALNKTVSVTLSLSNLSNVIYIIWYMHKYHCHTSCVNIYHIN